MFLRKNYKLYNEEIIERRITMDININDKTLKAVYLITIGTVTVAFIKMLKKFRAR